MGAPQNDPGTVEEFLQLHAVDRSGACWLWTKAVTHNGYGRVSHRGEQKRAHRVAYELAHGDVPYGMLVCHRCDNPACVNPAHLFVGSQLDNIRDMISKGRKVLNPPRGEAHPHARLSSGDVATILASGERSSTLAKRLAVTQQHVNALRRGAYRLHG